MNSNLVKANELYKTTVEGTGMSRVLKRRNLEDAIRIYNSEIHNTSLSCHPSLWKNLGMANLRLGEVLDPKFDLELIFHHLVEGIRALSTAWVINPQNRNSQWGQRIQETVSDSFQTAFRSLQWDTEFPSLDKFHLLDKIATGFGNDKSLDAFRIECFVAKGKYFYRCGVNVMNRNDFKTAGQLAEYARKEIQASSEYCGVDKNADFLSIIKTLEDDTQFLSCSCESVKYRVQGDQLFDTIVLQSEDLDYDMLWDMLDMYKAAAIWCRGIDLENEAIALSRQGRIYDKILNIREKAHKYYRAAFDLAMCFVNKDVNVPWLKECKTALERFQLDILKEEEAKTEEKKAPYLARMTVVLIELKEVHKLENPYKLLKYVYTKHPPKTTYEYEEVKVNSTNIKTCIMKAIIQYHPDKQVDYDMEWRILAEEITKCLNVRYETLK